MTEGVTSHHSEYSELPEKGDFLFSLLNGKSIK